MTREEKIEAVSKVLCKKDAEQCKTRNSCEKFSECRISEKTDEQLDYILSPIDKNIYLEACAGSGKTEVLGMKAAFEICRWEMANEGIAVLTFTNDATATIHERVSMFYRGLLPSIHYIGTFSSFVHGYISQKFAYRVAHARSSEMDRSFRIIDKETSYYDNRWLENYQLRFPFPGAVKVFANQLEYCPISKEWQCWHGREKQNLRSLYEKYKNCVRYKYEDLIKKAKECKKHFWKDGFATFEDMNTMAIRCLDDENVANLLAKRFPLILVDECQDLSKIELAILEKLMNAGSKVHYIGDLHQAIYGFKGADPQSFQNYIGRYEFEHMNLTDNFRSNQQVVDISRNIASIDHPVVGRVSKSFKEESCLYIEYSEEKDAIVVFTRLLAERGIPQKEAIVLTRTQAAKSRLKHGGGFDQEKHLLIGAIQFWQEGSSSSQKQAFCLLGRQLQKWYGFSGNSKNYYYDSEMCDNSLMWRMMLRDILLELSRIESIIQMEDRNYSEWYNVNKQEIVTVVNHKIAQATKIQRNLLPTVIRTPMGTGKELVGKIQLENADNLDIETVHTVKGGSFEAVLFISAQDAKGKTGYWENWLNSENEASRIAYVACTRPRQLLCWGVKTLNETQRNRIEQIGLKKYDPPTREQ